MFKAILRKFKDFTRIKIEISKFKYFSKGTFSRTFQGLCGPCVDDDDGGGRLR